MNRCFNKCNLKIQFLLPSTYVVHFIHSILKICKLSVFVIVDTVSGLNITFDQVNESYLAATQLKYAIFFQSWECTSSFYKLAPITWNSNQSHCNCKWFMNSTTVISPTVLVSSKSSSRLLLMISMTVTYTQCKRFSFRYCFKTTIWQSLSWKNF